MTTLKDKNPTLDHLVDIHLKGDSTEKSFYVRRNFENLQKEFPFLHNTIGVDFAIEKILGELKNEELYLAALDRIEGIANKCFYRNIALLLSKFYLQNNDEKGILKVIESYLIDEFKFHGYRDLLSYYALNYNKDKFLETFKKIEKKQSLGPYDRQAINLFIEKFTDITQDIEETKRIVSNNKIWSKTYDYIIPMMVGLFKSKEVNKLHLIEEMVLKELGDLENNFLIIENILNELYKVSNSQERKSSILEILQNLGEKTPKELYVKGYPSKVWSLILWRVGCKYVEMNNPKRAEEIIRKLEGKNKESLKYIYDEKFKINSI